MQLRRRLVPTQSKWATPVVAIIASVSVVAAAVFAGNDILNTQSAGNGPIETTTSQANFGDGETVVVDDPAIAAQGGEGGPRAVKEFHQDEPFSQFALTWEGGDKDLAAFVRPQLADGTWGEWYDAEPLGIETGGTNGTELIFIGETQAVQVSVGNVNLGAPSEEEVAEAGGQANPAPSAENDAEKGSEAPAKETTSPLPTNYGDIAPVAETVDQSAGIDAADLNAVFIDGNAQEGGIEPTAFASNGAPQVVSRAGWGANEGIRCQGPTYDDRVKALTLHHTAGSNNYTRAQAAAQVRGIFSYHAQTLGWCDIGYNALVDKYGTIYEGRYGGLDKAVQGAHVGGFNSNTWGISMIGNYSTAEPTQAMLNSVSDIAGWKAAISGFDPAGKSVGLYSGGFSGSKFAAGTTAPVPAFHGHNDLHNTSCPGDRTMEYWNQIRSNAHKKYEAVKSGGSSQPSTPAPSSDNSGNSGNSGNDGNASAAGNTGGAGTPVQYSVGGSSMSTADIEAAATIAAAVTGLAITSGALTVPNKDQEVVEGLTLGQVPEIISKVVSFLGDPALQQSWGSILNAFGPLLGLPQGGLEVLDQDTFYQLFENGVVLSSGDNSQAYALVGEIAKAWSEGDNAQQLGMPTTNQYSIGGKAVRVDFEGGYITYDPDTQQVQLHTNE